MESGSRKRLADALNHTQPDRIPIDFGGTSVTGIHVSVVAALRDYYGLDKHPVRVSEPGQMLGTVEEDLERAMGLDVTGVFKRGTKWGVPAENWKPWKLNGLEVLVPGEFNVTTDANGDTLAYPLGDTTLAPSGRMPKDGYFFDSVERQLPFDEDHLDPEENVEEYGAISQADLDFLAEGAKQAAATGMGVAASFGGTAFGDVALVPGTSLKQPKGVRSVAEWYMVTASHQDFVHQVFERQCEIAIENLAKIYEAVGDRVQVAYICGTDFGTQTSAFCSVRTFDNLYAPYYKRVNGWIHDHTQWKTFKHTCGAVSKFVPSLIESGFDILNPVQCSATGMDPEQLKANFGKDIVFWGGGVDTQKVLPFGTPEEVREQVLRRCEIFAPGGGFVFNTIHNIQACTPVENIVAMINAVHEFNGSR
ncbi:MAG: uroporphyrinogen decarboxylase family protein [Terracidiphilus sp.]|nr:uroporphyrinogen decarboxylase family protein [Terracidiphilus sp.]